MEHTINRTRTIYGYDSIYRFFATNTNLSNNGHNNEYKYDNVLFVLDKYYLHIRIYTDNTRDICNASMIFYYDDFAIQYTHEKSDIILLSRKGERVSAEMYISIKGIMA